VLWALLVGAAVSAVVIVYMLLMGRGLKTGIPYAPFLCVGAMALLLVHPMMFV
jgi:prepilin signal peptidase PulO-like enzyme (type II secretory pathway)